MAWAVPCGLLGLPTVAISDQARTAQLTAWINGLTAGLGIWLVAWPLPHTIWRKRPPNSARPEEA